MTRRLHRLYVQLMKPSGWEVKHHINKTNSKVRMVSVSEVFARNRTADISVSLQSSVLPLGAPKLILNVNYGQQVIVAGACVSALTYS